MNSKLSILFGIIFVIYVFNSYKSINEGGDATFTIIVACFSLLVFIYLRTEKEK